MSKYTTINFPTDPDKALMVYTAAESCTERQPNSLEVLCIQLYKEIKADKKQTVDEEFIENMVEAELDRDQYKKALEEIYERLAMRNSVAEIPDPLITIAKEALK